jgi:diguanylate cyclase (GGDEF)-like protein
MLPLVVSGKTVGLVELVSREPRQFTEYELDTSVTMSNQAGAVLENARLVDQLRRAADIDQVTAVHNHRYLQERLKQELARSGRARSPLAVLMIDLDGFKGINDRFGHADGDKVLRSIAAGIKFAVRSNDIVARYGGDEFVVLMPDTPEMAARVVADRVVTGIRNRRHAMHDGTEVGVGASAGLAVFPDDARTPQALLRAADAAMYSVKRAGGSAVRRAAPGAVPVVAAGTGTAPPLAPRATSPTSGETHR